MKNNLVNIAVIFCLLCSSMLVLSCSKNKPRRGCGEYEVCNITAVDVDMDSTCMADIYDMEIIKLENTKKSLISQVHKLIVNSKGILVYDNSSVPQVFSFDHTGKFLSKIGKFGHAKNEYDHVLDVCSNAKGDSVVFLQFGQTKIFDDKGNYLTSYPVDGKYHWEHIERNCNGGYVGASEYTNADNIVSVCDNSFNITGDFVDSKGIDLSRCSYVWNPIWSSHGKIIFCDFYFTSICVIDEATCKTTRYNIDTGNVASVKNGYDEYDDFMDVGYDGECVFGRMIHNKHISRFKFDIREQLFTIYCSAKDWHPDIKTYHDGYFYAVLEPSFLLSLLEAEPRYMYKETYRALMEALEPYAQNIDEMDNLYILKMKKRIQ